MNLKEVEDTPLWSFAIDKLNRAIHYMVYKGQKGARKRIYIKANITSTYGITPYRYISKAWAGKPLHG